MQIKTIENTIRAKLNEWLASITDESLRGKVKNNLLLSGGSITSMLINADVNDYDIYIKDVDVLLGVVKYYAYERDGVVILDGRNKKEYTPDAGKDNAYAISVHNLHEDQIKLFFESKDGGLKVEDDPPQQAGGVLPKYRPLFFSPNAISLSDNIQIVIRFHGDDVAVHKTFDFIHATNYFTFESGLVTNKEALESILTRQLKYQGSQYPLTSIIRMKKFIKRGWNINAGEILKIMFQISELDLKDPNVLEEQLIGVDVAYFSKLIEILRGVEPGKITSPYLNAIIDKVFNSADNTEEE